MSESPKCPAKHTKYQPPDDAWKCPKCGATSNAASLTAPCFIIEDPDEEALSDCGLLHERDNLSCGCGYGTSGKAFAARHQKAANMVPCPTCKGHGLVKADAKEGA